MKTLKWWCPMRILSIASFVVFSVVFSSICTLAFAVAPEGPLKGEIILPGEFDYSEAGEFVPELCEENQVTDSVIKKLCFGRTEVHERSVRSLLLIGASGAQAHYLELNPAPVEMFKPVFEIVGPIKKVDAESWTPEIGEATILIDKHGKVVEIKVSTPRLGMAKAVR